MADPGAVGLNQAWQAAQDRLPAGWTLGGLRCASTGLGEAQRSDDWIAVAAGPDGTERSHRAADPTSALDGLVGSLSLPAPTP